MIQSFYNSELFLQPVLILYGCLERMRGREENQSLCILRLSPILVVSHHLKQVESVLSGCVQSNDMCSLFVFDCCHLCLPVWMTCALECRMCFENENVFRLLLRSANCILPGEIVYGIDNRLHN